MRANFLMATIAAAATAGMIGSTLPALAVPAAPGILGAQQQAQSTFVTAEQIEKVQYRGRGGGRGWGRGAGRGLGFGVGAAILGGALVGQALAGPRYYGYGSGYGSSSYYYDRPYTYGPARSVYAAPAYDGDDAVSYCLSRFRSYDPRSGTYLGFDGYRHPCP